MGKVIANRGVVVVIAVLLVGCGNQIGKSVHQAVIDNHEAQTLTEWELSDANPETLFEKWRNDVTADPRQLEKIENEICQELIELDGQALSLFENEIRNQVNQDLIAPCQAHLISKLDEYYDSERIQLKVGTNALQVRRSKNNFRFQPNTQLRDISKGYFAASGDVARKEVILTFDDGPSGLYTNSILQSLGEVNAKAIFFQLGKNVRENGEIVKKVAQQGHGIGSHSESHSCLGTSNSCRRHNGRLFSLDEAVAEIESGHQAIYDVLGWVDPFFRFPYGEASPDLKSFLNLHATAQFAWNIESEDWRAQPTEILLNRVLTQLEAKGRGMILMHDIQRRTAEALPQLLLELYTRGYSVVLLQAADPAAKYNSKLVKKKLP